MLTVNYYDGYTYDNAATPPVDVLGQPVTASLKGLATCNWTRVLEDDTSENGTTTETYYDAKGRTVETTSENYLGGRNEVLQLLDFTGKTLMTKTLHKRLAGSTPVTTVDSLSYTAQDRPDRHTHTIGTGPTEVLSANGYDALGQLIVKKVGGHGDGPYQKVDYNYNIRGWMTDINNVHDIGDDLFTFHINYNEDGAEVDDYTQRRLYNGNISETYWRTSHDNILRQYGYFYDDLNRLRDAVYIKPEAGLVTNSYNESLQYDMNGNITTLVRNGHRDADDNYPLEIDNLAYTYQSNSNKLKAVNDASLCLDGFRDNYSWLSVEYSFDAKGNMTKDLNKHIDKISYNHLNLPVKIEFANGSEIEYLYDATGIKTGKTVTDANSNTTKTDYLFGYQYTDGALQFFPTSEGYVKATTNHHNQTTAFNYVYNYTDHLGNIRVSYGWDDIERGVKILEENNYYPFGLKHENYNVGKVNFVFEDEMTGEFNVVLAPVDEMVYKYKYNGKELQDELGLNLYDYGARNYDPALGRWMNVDPLAEVSRKYSPYTFAFNSPMIFVDPDGMMPYKWDDQNFETWDYSKQNIESAQENGEGYEIGNRAMGDPMVNGAAGDNDDWIIHKTHDGKDAVTYDSTVTTVEEAKTKGYNEVSEVFKSGPGWTENGFNVIDFLENGEYSVNSGAWNDVDDTSYQVPDGPYISKNKGAFDTIGDIGPELLSDTGAWTERAGAALTLFGGGEIGVPLMRIGATFQGVAAIGENFNDLCEGKFSFKKAGTNLSFFLIGKGLGNSGNFTRNEKIVNDQVLNISQEAVKPIISR